MAAAKIIKEEGGENDLIDRLAADPLFKMTREEIESILKPENFIGRADRQVEEFLSETILPLIEKDGGQKFDIKIEV